MSALRMPDLSGYRPDEQILALASQHLVEWLRQTGVDGLRAMIAEGGDLPGLLPHPLPLGALGRVRRGVLRARLLVPRWDLYREILRRVEEAGCADAVRVIRQLDGALSWYTASMERMRLRVLQELDGGDGA